MARHPSDCGDLARQILSHNPYRMRYTLLGEHTAFEHHMLPLNIGTTKDGDLALTADNDILNTTYARLTDNNPPRIRAKDTTSRLTYLGVKNTNRVNSILDPGETTPAYTEHQVAYHLANQNHAIASQGITYLAVGDHQLSTYNDDNTNTVIGITNQALHKATQIHSEHTWHIDTANDIRTPTLRNTTTNRKQHATAIDATTRRR